MAEKQKYRIFNVVLAHKTYLNAFPDALCVLR